MVFQIDGESYNVIINKKDNKNTYIRVDDDLNIIINTNYFTTKHQIETIINKNYKDICKMINKQKSNLEKSQKFKCLGNYYKIVYDDKYKSVAINENVLYVQNEKKLDAWYKDKMQKVYFEHLKYNYQKFEENIPFPSLRIRKMKTRWGVCNVKTKTVTLNSLLFRESIEKLDYVIIHELSHLVHFNHSKNFWALVSKYCPNYKEIRKALKE